MRIRRMGNGGRGGKGGEDEKDKKGGSTSGGEEGVDDGESKMMVSGKD